jgi:hypothetical protein
MKTAALWEIDAVKPVRRQNCKLSDSQLASSTVEDLRLDSRDRHE